MERSVWYKLQQNLQNYGDLDLSTFGWMTTWYEIVDMSWLIKMIVIEFLTAYFYFST